MKKENIRCPLVQHTERAAVNSLWFILGLLYFKFNQIIFYKEFFVCLFVYNLFGCTAYDLSSPTGD